MWRSKFVPEKTFRRSIRRIERVGQSKLIQANLTEPDVELFMNLTLSLVHLMKSLGFGPGLSLFMMSTPLQTYNSVCIKCHTGQPLASLLDQNFFFLIYLFIYFYTGPILIAVFITEMVILFKHVVIIVFFSIHPYSVCNSIISTYTLLPYIILIF